jgi:hypothetical protein
MPRPRVAEDSQQVAVRISNEWVARAEAIAQALTRDGYSSTRADVLRAALAAGLTALERKHGIKRGK